MRVGRAVGGWKVEGGGKGTANLVAVMALAHRGKDTSSSHFLFNDFAIFFGKINRREPFFVAFFQNKLLVFESP